MANDVDLDTIARALEGYSGADIKYICDRAATIPFLKSVTSGDEHEINAAMINEAIADTAPSVDSTSLDRFIDWRRRTDRA